jgi:hypothetical protein
LAIVVIIDSSEVSSIEGEYSNWVTEEKAFLDHNFLESLETGFNCSEGGISWIKFGIRTLKCPSMISPENISFSIPSTPSPNVARRIPQGYN